MGRHNLLTDDDEGRDAEEDDEDLKSDPLYSLNLQVSSGTKSGLTPTPLPDKVPS